MYTTKLKILDTMAEDIKCTETSDCIGRQCFLSDPNNI